MAYPVSIFNTRSATDPGAPTLNVATVTGAATVYSDLFAGEAADGYGMTVFTTGTLSGTFTLWVTDKMFASLADDTDWVQDTGFVPVNPAGAAAKFRDDAGNAKGAFKRLKFVNASGTGTLQGFVTTPAFFN
jgi:hypothetical protein